MKIFKKFKLNMISILLLTLIAISIIYAIRNTIAVNINFYTSNITIREVFFLNNDPRYKGSHEPSKRYINLIRKNYSLIKHLNFVEIKEKLRKISNLDINNTDYYKENNLIQTLINISKLPDSEKKISGLYISKDVDTYSNLSCDIYMMPFLVPAITNVVMLNGLPNRDLASCYSKSFEYGYARYFVFNKFYDKSPFNKKQLCIKVNNEMLKKIIQVKETSNNTFKTIIHEC